MKLWYSWYSFDCGYIVVYRLRNCLGLKPMMRMLFECWIWLSDWTGTLVLSISPQMNWNWQLIFLTTLSLFLFNIKGMEGVIIAIK